MFKHVHFCPKYYKICLFICLFWPFCLSICLFNEPFIYVFIHSLLSFIDLFLLFIVLILFFIYFSFIHSLLLFDCLFIYLSWSFVQVCFHSFNHFLNIHSFIHIFKIFFFLSSWVYRILWIKKMCCLSLWCFFMFFYLGGKTMLQQAFSSIGFTLWICSQT